MKQNFCQKNKTEICENDEKMKPKRSLIVIYTEIQATIITLKQADSQNVSDFPMMWKGIHLSRCI